jgi:hypothetical protein
MPNGVVKRSLVRLAKVGKNQVGAARAGENAGKVMAVRHPVNGYRLFKRGDLDGLLQQVAQATGEPSRD